MKDICSDILFVEKLKENLYDNIRCGIDSDAIKDGSFAGHFRKTLPLITQRTCIDIIRASLKSSCLVSSIVNLNLWAHEVD